MNAYALLGSANSRPGTSTPKGCFVLRADFIRPYNCGGRAADGSTARRSLQLVYPNRFLSGGLPGGLGHQRMRTILIALLSGGTAAQGVYYGF